MCSQQQSGDKSLGDAARANNLDEELGKLRLLSMSKTAHELPKPSNLQLQICLAGLHHLCSSVLQIDVCLSMWEEECNFERQAEKILHTSPGGT